MTRVGAIVGPFNYAIQHVHNVPHIQGRERKLVEHEHPVSLKLHFQAVSPNEPSFLDIHTTRKDLDSFLREMVEERVFDIPFEQVSLEFFQKINEWIPTFCKKFGLPESFTLSALNMQVESHRDELHHSEGVTEYYVATDTIGSGLNVFRQQYS